MNKKYILILSTITLLVIILGVHNGINDFKDNQPEQSTASQNIEQCIITVQGNQYNVTEFKKKHPGGDIFKCGEDMSEAFQKKHKGYLPMIEKLKVN